MDMSALFWLGGICFTGFGILLGFIVRLFVAIGKINVDLEKRVPFDYLEKNIIKKLDDLLQMVNDLRTEIATLKN